jgi:hypothetical protein
VTDLPPRVGGIPSTEEWNECRLWAMEPVLAVRPVGTVEKDLFPLTGVSEFPMPCSPVMYGLLFLADEFFFEWDLMW